MIHRYIELQARSPLAIRADHASGGTQTTRFITGTTLLGSLAATHRMLRSGKKANEFEMLFLNDNVQYPNLYPAFFNDNNMHKSRLPVYPAPKTAETCKRFPGFRYKFPGEKRNDEERHGVRDSLLDWAVFKLNSENEATRLEAFQEFKVCKSCSASMSSFDGKYYRQDAKEHMIVSQSNTHLQTHTGINREWGTVQENILYNREVFEEDMSFWGLVKLADNAEFVELFENFIQEANEEDVVRIGTGRTRGLGQVHLYWGEIESERGISKEDLLKSFKERLKTFNDSLCDRAEKKMGIKKLAPFYFALTLYSPVILCDDVRRYYGTINEEVLSELSGLSAENFNLVYQAASARRVTGWNELWGTPRTNEYALDIGSVFLFESTVEPDAAFWQALFRLEEKGIGRRKVEGFGRICISDPFHLKGELQ